MKSLLRFIAIIIILISLIFVYVQFTWNKTFDAPYPEVVASTDSATIARGKYIIYGPGHCATCHVPEDKETAVESGEIVPLTGGRKFAIPLGDYFSSNLTPDEETGIGRLTDGEIARTLRHSVGNDGRVIVPFMPFQGMSDADLTAIISYLRSLDPIKFNSGKTQLNLLGKALYAFGMMKPEGPKTNPPKSVVIDSTAAYGRYIAYNVANCIGCHTQRNMATGEFIGKPFAGGLRIEPDPANDNYGFITPNLTPDPETGIMADWDEQTFINRFRKGKILPVMGMPWGSFSRMNDLELKALYRFFRSLEPVKNSIQKTVYAPGEKLPES